MKKIYSTLLAITALGMTSCSDFLDLIPLNDIVAENYWTERADLQSVLYGCYSQLESADVMQRMFVWGEVRSDNVTKAAPTPYDLQQIIDENILETNPWVNWTSIYQLINRCNTVIYYAPIVAEKDPNYNESEVRANIAEATFLRSLAYFYLIRTFRDVPYTTQPSLDDNHIDEDYRLPATPFAEVLDNLIASLESVKGDALRLYPIESSTGDAANTSRVTTCAIYALLADLYLWKGDYQQCVNYCDQVLAYKMERYEELKDETPDMAARIELWFEKYPLLMEQPSGNSQGAAYNAIFGQGNSFESIFELYFYNSRSSENQLVSKFFGYGSAANTAEGQCAVYSGLVTGVYDKTNIVFKPTDCRVPECIEERGSDNYFIRKYAYQESSFSIDNKSSNISKPTRPGTMRSTNYANWIIYRLTDVLLMKAEALVEMGSTEQQDEAFEIVSAIYNRANNFNAASTDILARENYLTQQQMRELVLEERRRELLFEGKRWFDLVRYSLRAGNNNYMVTAVKQKQKERVSAIALQLQDRNALFWPYLEKELDANPLLKQNEAYLKNETSQK